MARTGQTYAQILADFVLNLQSDQIPSAVVKQAQLSTLDFIGVALAGSKTPSASAVADYVRAVGGVNEATIFASDSRVPMAQAALANGTMAHSIELDDHEAHHRSKVHAAAVVMPAAWAASETGHVSGREFLTAVILGYDVIGRLSAVTKYPDFLGVERGFHTTPLFGPFAAGATAARLLGLSHSELSNGFGILGSMASGLSETHAAGSWVKGLHPGWAAHSGLVAAQLAQRGFTGPLTVFEGKRGFYRAFCGEGNFDLDVIDADLGVDFDISLTMYKAYACAGGIHSPLTAVDVLRAGTEIKAEDVAEVIVWTNRHVLEAFTLPREAKYAPKTGAQGQFSMPYAIAALLVDGAALIAQFTDAAVQRPEILQLTQRVRVEVDEGLSTGDPEEEPSRVQIHLNDGRVLDATVSGGKGSLTVPMGTEELVAKFHSLADQRIGEVRARAIEERVLSLWSDEPVGDLPGSLVATHG